MEHQQHHCLSKPKVRRQEPCIPQLKMVLAQFEIFSPDPDTLSGATQDHTLKLLPHDILPIHTKESIHSPEQIGTKEEVGFVEYHVTVNANYVGQHDQGETDILDNICKGGETESRV